MNRKVEKSDWDNDALSELKAVDEQPKLIRLDIVSDISGVETEDMHGVIIGSIPISNKKDFIIY